MSLADLRKDLSFAGGILRRGPFHCLIQVTNRCNMRCSFCDFWTNGAPPRLELTVDDYRRLEEGLSDLGTFVISVEGGEPLLRPDLVEIVRVLGRRHLPVLYTNGWHVTPALARDLFQAGLAEAAVSVDYAEPARHDKKRGLGGAFERAWRAVEAFRDAAPRGGGQVHVMTVLMRDNQDDLEPLVRECRRRGVGWNVTLLSKTGYRRGKEGPEEPPEPAVEAKLLRLWRQYRNFRALRGYLGRMGAFLGGGTLPACRAGVQSFNVDHLGAVSPCIEKIDVVMGNAREEPLPAILARGAGLDAVRGCQDCWTSCRGFGQALGAGGGLSAWADLALRLR